jgi:transcriptional regulator with PAS, ATPase and Fis domain
MQPTRELHLDCPMERAFNPMKTKRQFMRPSTNCHFTGGWADNLSGQISTDVETRMVTAADSGRCSHRSTSSCLKLPRPPCVQLHCRKFSPVISDGSRISISCGRASRSLCADFWSFLSLTSDNRFVLSRGTTLAAQVLLHARRFSQNRNTRADRRKRHQLEGRNMQTPLAMNRQSASENVSIHSFVGMTALVCSRSMTQLMEKVKRTANSNAAVLITGETGSGKELIARAIHHYSLQCARSWVDVNCAALPDHLLESELFGYEKGAFSGAATLKQGMFELANGGTLFLDEIGELDLKMQVKLLRVLDGVPYYRLGGTRKVTTDVRIVAATNVNLEDAVEKGLFRRDLFHRLDQARLRVPSLKERPEDIVALSRYFLSTEFPLLHFSESALQAMCSHSWTGNVRELRNVVIKAALSADNDEIDYYDLPEDIRGGGTSAASGGRTLELLEQHAILTALSETRGRQDSAAQLLGISTRTLIRKLKTYRTLALAS